MFYVTIICTQHIIILEHLTINQSGRLLRHNSLLLLYQPPKGDFTSTIKFNITTFYSHCQEREIEIWSR